MASPEKLDEQAARCMPDIGSEGRLMTEADDKKNPVSPRDHTRLVTERKVTNFLEIAAPPVVLERPVNNFHACLSKSLAIFEICLTMACLIVCSSVIYLPGKAFRIMLSAVLAGRLLAAVIICQIVQHRYLK
jgi:hypothetical protein